MPLVYPDFLVSGELLGDTGEAELDIEITGPTKVRLHAYLPHGSAAHAWPPGAPHHAPLQSLLATISVRGHVLTPSLRLVVDRVLRGLLSSRDFLGLQLDNAVGNIATEEFDKLVVKHFQRPSGSEADIRSVVEGLRVLTSVDLDAETLADILNVEIADVARVSGSLSTGSELKVLPDDLPSC